MTTTKTKGRRTMVNALSEQTRGGFIAAGILGVMVLAMLVSVFWPRRRK